MTTYSIESISIITITIMTLHVMTVSIETTKHNDYQYIDTPHNDKFTMPMKIENNHIFL
jgi:hypothetical protein